jgi:hypothetical protein
LQPGVEALEEIHRNIEIVTFNPSMKSFLFKYETANHLKS